MNSDPVVSMHKLILWVNNPTTVADLQAILFDISTGDLMAIALMTQSQSVGRIAWSEFAVRRGFFDLEFLISESELVVRTPGLPVHDVPVLKEPLKQ